MDRSVRSVLCRHFFVRDAFSRVGLSSSPVWMLIMNTRPGLHRIDTAQLLASGAMTGPHRRTRPVTLSLWKRIERALRAIMKA